MAGYRLAVVTREEAESGGDWQRIVADDPRVRTVRGFRRAYPAALGLRRGEALAAGYAYAEVQAVSDADPDVYDVVDSWSATWWK